MAGAQFTCPLIVVIPGQLITANLWNNEFLNIATNLNPSGIDGYMDTTTQAQIQTNPYPSSILNLAGSLGGELERIRYQISALIGGTYWYNAPANSIATLNSVVLPIGGIIDYHSATPPSSNFLLANGQAIGRSAYAALNTLYSAASYPFGTGDGSTTFNLPNYTDRMSIAAGNLYALAATGGAVSQAIALANLPANGVTVNITDPGHNHSQNAHSHSDSGHSHTEVSNNSGTDVGGHQGITGGNYDSINPVTTGNSTLNGTANISNTTATNNSNTTGITAATANLGSGTALPVLNPYLAMYKLIRVL